MLVMRSGLPFVWQYLAVNLVSLIGAFNAFWILTLSNLSSLACHPRAPLTTTELMIIQL